MNFEKAKRDLSAWFKRCAKKYDALHYALFRRKAPTRAEISNIFKNPPAPWVMSLGPPGHNAILIGTIVGSMVVLLVLSFEPVNDTTHAFIFREVLIRSVVDPHGLVFELPVSPQEELSWEPHGRISGNPARSSFQTQKEILRLFPALRPYIVKSLDGLHHFRNVTAKRNVRHRNRGNLVDPVTMSRVNPRNAYYFAPNVLPNGRVQSLYSYATIQQILKTTGKSPFTQRPVFLKNVRRMNVATQKGRVAAAALAIPNLLTKASIRATKPLSYTEMLKKYWRSR